MNGPLEFIEHQLAKQIFCQPLGGRKRDSGHWAWVNRQTEAACQRSVVV